jgi:hypothetical protein
VLLTLIEDFTSSVSDDIAHYMMQLDHHKLALIWKVLCSTSDGGTVGMLDSSARAIAQTLGFTAGMPPLKPDLGVSHSNFFLQENASNNFSGNGNGCPPRRNTDDSVLPLAKVSFYESQDDESCTPIPHSAPSPYKPQPLVPLQDARAPAEYSKKKCIFRNRIVPENCGSLVRPCRDANATSVGDSSVQSEQPMDHDYNSAHDTPKMHRGNAAGKCGAQEEEACSGAFTNTVSVLSRTCQQCPAPCDARDDNGLSNVHAGMGRMVTDQGADEVHLPFRPTMGVTHIHDMAGKPVDPRNGKKQGPVTTACNVVASGGVASLLTHSTSPVAPNSDDIPHAPAVNQDLDVLCTSGTHAASATCVDSALRAGLAFPSSRRAGSVCNLSAAAIHVQSVPALRNHNMDTIVADDRRIDATYSFSASTVESLVVGVARSPPSIEDDSNDATAVCSIVSKVLDDTVDIVCNTVSDAAERFALLRGIVDSTQTEGLPQSLDITVLHMERGSNFPCTSAGCARGLQSDAGCPEIAGKQSGKIQIPAGHEFSTWTGAKEQTQPLVECSTGVLGSTVEHFVGGNSYIDGSWSAHSSMLRTSGACATGPIGFPKKTGMQAAELLPQSTHSESILEMCNLPTSPGTTASTDRRGVPERSSMPAPADKAMGAEMRSGLERSRFSVEAVPSAVLQETDVRKGWPTDPTATSHKQNVLMECATESDNPDAFIGVCLPGNAGFQPPIPALVVSTGCTQSSTSGLPAMHLPHCASGSDTRVTSGGTANTLKCTTSTERSIVSARVPAATVQCTSTIPLPTASVNCRTLRDIPAPVCENTGGQTASDLQDTHPICRIWQLCSPHSELRSPHSAMRCSVICLGTAKSQNAWSMATPGTCGLVHPTCPRQPHRQTGPSIAKQQSLGLSPDVRSLPHMHKIRVPALSAHRLHSKTPLRARLHYSPLCPNKHPLKPGDSLNPGPICEQGDDPGPSDSRICQRIYHRSSGPALSSVSFTQHAVATAASGLHRDTLHAQVMACSNYATQQTAKPLLVGTATNEPAPHAEVSPLNPVASRRSRSSMEAMPRLPQSLDSGLQEPRMHPPAAKKYVQQLPTQASSLHSKMRRQLAADGMLAGVQKSGACLRLSSSAPENALHSSSQGYFLDGNVLELSRSRHSKNRLLDAARSVRSLVRSHSQARVVPAQEVGSSEFVRAPVPPITQARHSESVFRMRSREIDAPLRGLSRSTSDGKGHAGRETFRLGGGSGHSATNSEDGIGEREEEWDFRERKQDAAAWCLGKPVMTRCTAPARRQPSQPMTARCIEPVLPQVSTLSTGPVSHFFADRPLAEAVSECHATGGTPCEWIQGGRTSHGPFCGSMEHRERPSQQEALEKLFVGRESVPGLMWVRGECLEGAVQPAECVHVAAERIQGIGNKSRGRRWPLEWPGLPRRGLGLHAAGPLGESSGSRRKRQSIGIRGLVGNLSLQRRLRALATISANISADHSEVQSNQMDLVAPNEVLRGRRCGHSPRYFPSLVMPCFPHFSRYIPRMPLHDSGCVRASEHHNNFTGAPMHWALPVLSPISDWNDAWNKRRRKVQRDLLGIDAALQQERESGGKWSRVDAGIGFLKDTKDGGDTLVFHATEVFTLLFEVCSLVHECDVSATAFMQQSRCMLFATFTLVGSSTRFSIHVHKSHGCSENTEVSMRRIHFACSRP